MSRLLEALHRRARPAAPAPCDGNAVEIVFDGDAYFERLWADIDAAARRVWLEVYLLEPDAVGRATLARLAAAAARGCDVLLVYDAIGSATLADAHLAALRAAGGRCYRFNPVWPWRAHGPWLFRDHRKLALIDADIAWLGGRNVGRRYAGARLGDAPFRDTQVRLRGPAVAQLAQALAETLAELGAAPPPAPLAAAAPAGTVRVEVLCANARRQRLHLQARLRQAITLARQRCWLTTPYPVPSRRLLRALARRARAGVDVRLLAPARSDVRLVDLARGFVVRKLAAAGVRLYVYPAPLHAKTLLVDEAFAAVGSFNMDAFTSAHNLEIGLAVYDAGVTDTLARQFLDDLAQARPLQPRPRPPGPWQRLLEWLAYRVLALRVPWRARPRPPAN